MIVPAAPDQGIRCTASANDFQLAADADDVSHELTIHYDYLNPNDGAVLELMHDGTGATVVGKARGLKGGPENCGRIVPGRAATFARYFVLALSFGGPLVVLPFLWALLLRDESLATTGTILLGFALTTFFVLAAVPNVATIWRQRRRHPKALSP